MELSATAIKHFLAQHQLPDSYADQMKAWFQGIAEEIAMHQKSANRPFVVGIHGAQGSGKSSLANCLVFLFETLYQQKAVALSLDDFYFSRAQREALATSVHPLLMTRGVPGTHDTALAITTLEQLCDWTVPVRVPKFDKAVDDRIPESEWLTITEPPQLIVLEGWCLGALPQNAADLEQCINTLEAHEDKDKLWRKYVNQQLTHAYPDLFAHVDYWLMLKAPDFDCIYQWRLEQERHLAKHHDEADTAEHIMDAEELARFIQFYQRLTEHCLETLPNKMDAIFELNAARQITALTHPNHPTSPQEITKLLIFTDLDGTLLDHHNYRHDDADAMLAHLEALHIPVIPVSSKTQSEIELLRYSIHNKHPFISENGAAVFIPNHIFSSPPKDTRQFEGYWVKEFVQPRKHWQRIIDGLRAEFGSEFTTFADAGIDGIIAMTGLDVHAAARAARRQYGEAISWHGSVTRKNQFCKALTMAGANVLHGGRFMHVSGLCDKGKALKWLSELYQQHYKPYHLMTLAIGDSQNDIAMLEEADLALLIPSPVQELPKIAPRHGVFTAQHYGPRGWAQSVGEILASLKITTADIAVQEQAHG